MIVTEHGDVLVVRKEPALALHGHSYWRFAEQEQDTYRPDRLWVSQRCAHQIGATAEKLNAVSYSTLSAEDWAVCIVKPDAKERGMEARIAGEIRERVGQASFALSRYNVTLDEARLDRIWPAPLDEDGRRLPPSPWWGATVDYMTSAPVDIHMVHGKGATAALLDVKAELRRELYGEGYQSDPSLDVEQRVRSVIHTSDNDRELVNNLLAFWPHGIIRSAVQKERT